MWTRNGLEWNKWFPYDGPDDEKWQIKNKLKNEFKEVTEKEWKEIEKEQEENKHNNNKKK
jgi:hypothetical protein